MCNRQENTQIQQSELCFFVMNIALQFYILHNIPYKSTHRHMHMHTHLISALSMEISEGFFMRFSFSFSLYLFVASNMLRIAVKEEKKSFVLL